MELPGRSWVRRKNMVEFSRAAYQECKCQVKVGDMVSESFDVVKGLRQGCVLSPVLFFLYIQLFGEQAQRSRDWGGT